MPEKGSSQSAPVAEASTREALGLVQVYTGDGKGKTTAALGTILRASAHGLRICVVFFMKGKIPSGEHTSLTYLPNVTVLKLGGRGLVRQADLRTEDQEQAQQTFAAAREAVMSGNYDIVVLDEINLSVAWGLIELNELLRLIDQKPKNVELILTGRQAPTELVKRADLVTEMLKIKHPYDSGIKARKGVEY